MRLIELCWTGGSKPLAQSVIITCAPIPWLTGHSFPQVPPSHPCMHIVSVRAPGPDRRGHLRHCVQGQEVGRADKSACGHCQPCLVLGLVPPPHYALARPLQQSIGADRCRQRDQAGSQRGERGTNALNQVKLASHFWIQGACVFLNWTHNEPWPGTAPPTPSRCRL